MPISRLAGHYVLVVEDDYLVANDLVEELTMQGAEVIGPAGTVPDALRLVRNSKPISCALLDINLRDGFVYPVVDELRERGIPFMFLTGYDAASIDPAFAEVPRCEKPVDLEAVARLLS